MWHEVDKNKYDEMKIDLKEKWLNGCVQCVIFTFTALSEHDFASREV